MSLPPGVRIRAAGPGDAPFIQQVHEESIRGLGPGAYSRAEVESWVAGLEPTFYVFAMTHAGAVFLLAEEKRTVGFCSHAADEVKGLYVRPAWTRRGIGSALLTRAEAAIFASGRGRVRVSASLSGLGFYLARGYRIIRRRGWKTRGGLVIEVAEMEKALRRDLRRRL
jgi:putative acetyltransferase